ncbi:hypothetical protein NPIL_94251 [Nephila pilipes]|uniref:Uncharacterized protein n=1 Tax=Nephila pilipes TaxID=299642 RepID=A0A8X6PY40_NEPPI|nr:hypothetical protein NPIL_94251 [Nephila pilipes]
MLLSTSLFLLESEENHVPGIDGIDEEKPQRRARHEYQLKKHTKKLFHLETLGALISQGKPGDPTAMKLEDAVFA